MTSRDRVGLAMNLDVPDRVPVFCQLAIGHYFLNARPSPFDVWFRSGAFANALVELQRRYRFDGILVNLPGRVGQLPNLLFIECPLSSSIEALPCQRQPRLNQSQDRYVRQDRGSEAIATTDEGPPKSGTETHRA